jgi:type VI secretion system protein ImpA
MSESLLDPELLTAPLADGSIGGINLREDSAGREVWSAIRDLRDEARRIERRADDGDQDASWDAAVPLWQKIADRSREVLAAKSRDLGIAATFIEALARLDGFQGLADGFTVTQILVDRAWSDLFPIPDPEDGPADEAMIAEERAMPILRLVGLEGEGLLAASIMRIPLVESRDGDQFGLAHWRSSRELKGIDDAEKITMAVSRGGTAPEKFDAAAGNTPRDKTQQIFVSLRAARVAWDTLADSIDNASEGRVIVPTIPLRELFDECESAMRTFAADATDEVLRREREALEPDMADVEEGSDTGSETERSASGKGVASRPLTRDDMLMQLERVAEYFEQHDPHSLLGAQIRNIVRMARLSRSEYYRELIGDESALESLKRLAGLRFDDSSSDDY